MAEVLVLGGTGLLGRLVVAELQARHHAVRVLSRQPNPAPSVLGEAGAVQHVRGDLRDAASLAPALAGVDAVIHCASDPRHSKDVDVAGTAHLTEAMQAAGAAHLVYVSIVGVDSIPLGYYRAKWETERVVEQSTVGFTVQRATQFPQLLDTIITQLSRSPVLPAPRGLRFQPIHPGDLARRLVQHVDRGPTGRAPDLGGPEVHPFADLIRTWLAAHGRHRIIVPAPLPGKIGRALAAGANLCPAEAKGERSWQSYLEESTR
jgi:uncharacterized protein YbjT (DUF2867 family)